MRRLLLGLLLSVRNGGTTPRTSIHWLMVMVMNVLLIVRVLLLMVMMLMMLMMVFGMLLCRLRFGFSWPNCWLCRVIFFATAVPTTRTIIPGKLRYIVAARPRITSPRRTFGTFQFLL